MLILDKPHLIIFVIWKMRILKIDNLIVSCLKYRLVFQMLGEWKMYLLELYQNDYSKDFVVFDSLEDGKDFVSRWWYGKSEPLSVWVC